MTERSHSSFGHSVAAPTPTRRSDAPSVYGRAALDEDGARGGARICGMKSRVVRAFTHLPQGSRRLPPSDRPEPLLSREDL